jgi:hypothetical protein
MEKILDKHPNRVPVYVHVNEKKMYMERNKFLVPNELTVAEFTRVIRNRTKLKSSEAVFMFVGNSVLPPNRARFVDLYKEHAGEDQMLHVTYSIENTFG